MKDFSIIADNCWRETPDHFPFVELGVLVIMPNLVHGIIVFQFQKPVTVSLPTIVRTYKAAVTHRLRCEHNAPGIWQRNYYEHIIRDKKDLQR